MFKIIFATVIVGFFFFRNKKKKGGILNSSSLLLGLYLISMTLSIPLLIMDIVHYPLLLEIDVGKSQVFRPEYWRGTIAFISYLFLFLFPFTFFNERKIEQIIVPAPKILTIISIIIIVLSLYSIIYYASTVNLIFSSGDLGYARINMEEYRDSIGGVWNTIASVSASLYPFALLLFFIYYILDKQKFIRVLLLISSTSIIVNVLSFVGRDGVVFWIFTVAFMFSFFNGFIIKSKRRKLSNYFLVVAILALIPFLAISVGRFQGGSGGVFASILSYMGQSFPNYCLYFNVAKSHMNYGSSFPLFWEILGKGSPESTGQWIDGGTSSYVFGTFIEGFNINFGLIGTILVGLLMALIFIGIFGRQKKIFPYHYFFIYLLYFQILSQGVFYFRQYTRGGNLFILICIGLYYVFKSFRNTRNKIILTRTDNN